MYRWKVHVAVKMDTVVEIDAEDEATAASEGRRRVLEMTTDERVANMAATAESGYDTTDILGAWCEVNPVELPPVYPELMTREQLVDRLERMAKFVTALGPWTTSKDAEMLTSSDWKYVEKVAGKEGPKILI